MDEGKDSGSTAEGLLARYMYYKRDIDKFLDLQHFNT